ncbi:MAG: hypothetical protein K0S44_1024 [Bacteroidetes bacterium]|nr:hypothetical protein [Bacteroidota bacterium]
MQSETRFNYIPFLALFLLVFVSRLPFLSAGYGIEEDSWGIALAAFHTKLSGIYEPSRFPGHPVQELIYSALWGKGPVIFNGLSAFFSAIAAVYFARILQYLNFRHYFIAGLAFAFVPIVYISSTYTIDFMWSEAFVLMSFYSLLRNRLILCGLLLGLAVGCRITCGVMIIPFLIILWENNDLKKNFLSLLKICVPMVIVVFFVFLPLILQFGTSFFMYYDQFPYPPLSKVFYKMSLGVFGFIGCISILVFIIIAILNRKRSINGDLFIDGLPKKILFISFLIIVLYIISYFRLPQKSGYMLPIVPFVIILFAYYLNSVQFRILCFTLIVSSFIFSINLTDKLRGAEYSSAAVSFVVSGQEIFFDPLTGPICSDYSKRLQKIKYTSEVISKSSGLNNKTVIISGWWYNEIMVTLIGSKRDPNIIFEPYIPESKMKGYTGQGYEIVYLSEQNIYNDLMYQMDVTDAIAKPF